MRFLRHSVGGHSPLGNYALVQDKKVLNTVVWNGEEEVNFRSDVTAVLIPEEEAVSIGYPYG